MSATIKTAIEKIGRESFTDNAVLDHVLKQLSTPNGVLIDEIEDTLYKAKFQAGNRLLELFDPSNSKNPKKTGRALKSVLALLDKINGPLAKGKGKKRQLKLVLDIAIHKGQSTAQTIKPRIVKITKWAANRHIQSGIEFTINDEFKRHDPTTLTIYIMKNDMMHIRQTTGAVIEIPIFLDEEHLNLNPQALSFLTIFYNASFLLRYAKQIKDK